MFCGQCGTQSPDNHRFCAECGVRLRSDDPGTPLVDDASARLHGLGELPEPTVEWPDDLPREVRGVDGARLLLVPAGLFWMGATKQKKDERPRRQVYLDSYYVDESPVTRGQYQRFLNASRRKAPPGFRFDHPDWDRLPVTSVTWNDAEAYAGWAQRRLPTEAEWEKAARGVDERTWPWGDVSPDGREPPLACFGSEDADPVAVGSYPGGCSPFGALDMAGNVWEWTADLYSPDFYARAPLRNPLCTDGDAPYRVLRGGAVTSSSFTMRSTFRGWNVAHMRSGVYGFRCAVDARRFRKRKPGKSS